MTAPALLVERLDRLLPQTQCGQCGFDGCRPYAEAMALGTADIDRCPPGGDAGARALAHATGRPARPYDRSRGLHKPPLVALVVEADCIGCTKCIRACPVDAIVGGAKRMHVVVEPLCTGCELCIPACPVDCIVLLPPAGDTRAGTPQAEASTSPASRNTASASSSPSP
ncbi:electron transport complex protein RnfB [Lysobacteraceae bacterium NML91-0213]|nr:electron transport complex protein RnfB [Xanthomonadaceae bacterium NML91-0213]